MRHSIAAVALLSTAVFAVACGGSDGDAITTGEEPGPGEGKDPPGGLDSPIGENGTFTPPAAPEGYTRIVAPVIEGIAPGVDQQYCQYVFAPLDHDVDILDVQGFQSRSSHHAVAYAVAETKPVGTSGPCGDGDSMAGVYLGGIGGEGGGGISIPPGAAFRLPKGHGILLNAHFLNTTDETLDGESVLDVRFEDADPNRKIMSLFTNADVAFQIPPGSALTSYAECTLPRDIEFLMFGNHMHHRGTNVSTTVVRAGANAPEVVHDDPVWAAELEFRADFSTWDLDAPFVVRKGDTLRTECTWTNETTAAMGFPTEMCIGIGFFLSDGNSSPTCLNGSWLENMPQTL